MSDAPFEIQRDDFATVIPFGFVLDTDGAFDIVGDTLARRLGAKPGQPVDEVFEIVRPVRCASARDLPVAPKATTVLRVRDSGLELRGCTVAVGWAGDRVAFIGSTTVQDIQEFRALDLQVGDFSPGDAVPDLLISMQAMRSALDDARRMGSELEGALEQAHAATAAKARFLAVMSHEIRTPLNGFGSMIDLLREGGLTSEQANCLDTMDSCAQSLLVLVNDILEFSKLEAGKVELRPDPQRLHDSVKRSVRHFDAAASEKGVALHVESDLDPSVYCTIDAHRMRQVISNLVGNALKFTDQGSVTVRLSTLGEDTHAVDVLDTGVGIPENERDCLFEPFVQADMSDARKFNGTGLGLTISRQLAQALGGDVELLHSSAGGTGFRFTFCAPRCEAPSLDETTIRSTAAVTFENCRVLVAEDEPTNQMIAKKLLNRLAVDPVVVADGQAAVDAAASQHFDLVLMDLMMPNMGGMDATRAIRAGGGPCQDVPILAFSAAVSKESRDAALEAGMTDFIEKPARLKSLRAVLEEYLAGARAD